MSRTHVSILSGLLLAAGMISAQAQMPGGRAGPPDGLDGPPRGMPPVTLTGQFQGQLATLREALKLTPAQRPAWQSYEDQVMALMSDMTQAPEAGPEKQTAPERIERSVAVVRNRLTAMEDIAAAAQLLYRMLDDSQKKIADQRLAATLPPLYSGLMPTPAERSIRRGRPGHGAPDGEALPGAPGSS